MSTDVTIGPQPFGITASETNVDGYSITFCYECTVTPIGIPSVVF